MLRLGWSAFRRQGMRMLGPQRLQPRAAVPFLRFYTSSTEERQKYYQRVTLERFIQDLANQPVPTVTLNDLLRFTRDSGDNTGDKVTSILTDNANDTLQDLAVLVGRAIQRFTDLPYVVLMNPHMAKIYKCYTDTLKILLGFVEECQSAEEADIDPSKICEVLRSFRISTPEQNARCISMLQDILAIHTDNTVDLRDGFDEVGESSVDDRAFLDAHMRERILMRLLINHHILLASQLQESTDIHTLKSIGVIDMDVNVLEVLARSYDYVNDMAAMKYVDKIDVQVKTVVVRPDGSIKKQQQGDLAEFQTLEPVVFPYVSSHLEYVFDEILKNSTRASLDNHVTAPVEVLVLLQEPGETAEQSDEPYKLEVRITDYAKGIKPETVRHLFDYSFTTVDDSNAQNPKVVDITSATAMAGMGYGLPMSLTYTRLFDGDITLKSIYGQGTTVYLKWCGINRI